ncbi:MAG: protein-L-isoaspartate o-methyltransferase 1 [Chloroflexota bacterium]
MSPERIVLTEQRATELAQEAVERAGGARMIYRSPRQAFSAQSKTMYDIDGVPVEVRWGEISSPAIVTAGGYVFEILDWGIEVLVRPPKPRDPAPGSQ